LITKDSPSAAQCLIAAGQKVAAGKSVLNYVARAMEGNLPEDVEQWRALYVQAYHITGTVNRTCAGAVHDRCCVGRESAIVGFGAGK